MEWNEYYDKFYDWAESTQIKKLSSVDKLGPADEVADVMLTFAFNRVDIVNRIARKAIEQKIIFTAENIQDLTNSIDTDLQNQLALQSVSSFSKDDLVMLEGFLDEDVLVKLYKARGFKVPEELDYGELSFDFHEEEPEKQPSGFFSKLAMAFGIGAGIHHGIEDATRSNFHSFSVGDHVRVKYRGQEGTVVDINGDLYMVSLNDGSYVDSFSESELEKAW